MAALRDPDNPGAWLMATAKHRASIICDASACSHASMKALGHELQMEQQTNGGKLAKRGRRDRR